MPFHGFAVKCGRCGITSTSRNCAKLEHFGIYRVVCPHCGWPGRYVASELRPVGADEEPTMPKRKTPRAA
jgi:ribosomal protein S27AE